MLCVCWTYVERMQNGATEGERLHSSFSHFLPKASSVSATPPKIEGVEPANEKKRWQRDER